MTNDDMLSQEEINALLNVANTEDTETEDNQNTSENYKVNKLTTLEIDTLGEIGNISLGNSATTLSTLLGQKVEITTPSVSVVRKTGITEEFPYEHVSLQVNYIDGFDGENLFLMKATDAAIISDIMLGGEGLNPNHELSEIELSAVQEAMNQMMGASATSMSTVFSKRVDISPPVVDYKEIDKLEEVEEALEGDEFVKVSFHLKVGHLIDSEIMQLIPLQFAKTMVEQLLNPPEEISATLEQQETPKKSTNVEAKAPEPQTQKTTQPNHEAEVQHIGDHINEQSTVQPAAFSNFDKTELPQNNQRNLDMLLDIPLQVTVELGRTKKRIQDILDLSPGSVIELDKLAGEPVDVLVNQKLIAKGEVVVIDESFGVRVTDIISQESRLRNLN